MEELGIDGPVESFDVGGLGEAIERKFLGSPTIRINGLDVEPTARDNTNYAISCRVYHTDEGTIHYPSKAMIIKALKEALR